MSAYNNLFKHFSKSLRAKVSTPTSSTITEVMSELKEETLTGGQDMSKMIENIMTGGNNNETTEKYHVKFNIDPEVERNKTMKGGYQMNSNIGEFSQMFYDTYLSCELENARSKSIDVAKNAETIQEFDKIINKFSTFYTENWNFFIATTYRTFNKLKDSEDNCVYAPAYWKFKELSQRFNILNFQEVKHFDMCSAPGYYVLGIQELCKEKNLKYTYNTCSKDTAGLPYDPKVTNRMVFDVLTDKFTEEHLHKYNFVTADIGTQFDNKPSQETIFIDYFEKIFELTYDLAAEGGNVVIKIFTISTDRMMKLVDDFTKHFKRSYIVKPTSSKPFNVETFIIGQGFTLKEIPGKVDTNSKKVIDFESKRSEARINLLRAVTFIAKLKTTQLKIIEDNGNKIVGGLEEEEQMESEVESEIESENDTINIYREFVSETSDSNSESEVESYSDNEEEDLDFLL